MKAFLVLWLVQAMLAWVPPEASELGPEANRYARIAWTALDVAMDPDEPPLFQGPNGRAFTALQLLAVASFESQFRKDVQSGEKRGKAGDSCYVQIVIPSGKRMELIPQGTYRWVSYEEGKVRAAQKAKSETFSDLSFTHHALEGDDAHLCFRAGLHMLRESRHICHDLSLYTVGHCDKNEPKARHRAWRAQHYAESHALVTGED